VTFEVFFFLACALHAEPGDSLLIGQMQGWQTAGEFHIWTIVHNRNIVCGDAPQEQDGSEAWFQQTRLAGHRPWPVRKWFNVDHKRRRRSNPGGATEGSTTSEWLTTSEVDHAFFNPSLTCWNYFLLQSLKPYLWSLETTPLLRTSCRTEDNYRYCGKKMTRKENDFSVLLGTRRYILQRKYAHVIMIISLWKYQRRK